MPTNHNKRKAPDTGSKSQDTDTGTKKNKEEGDIEDGLAYIGPNLLVNTKTLNTIAVITGVAGATCKLLKGCVAGTAFSKRVSESSTMVMAENLCDVGSYACGAIAASAVTKYMQHSLHRIDSNQERAYKRELFRDTNIGTVVSNQELARQGDVARDTRIAKLEAGQVRLEGKVDHLTKLLTEFIEANGDVGNA